MPPISLTLNIHQSSRLKHYSFFDIGNSTSYEDEARTLEAITRLANDCILPASRILLKRLKEYGGDFRIALAVSGSALDQFECHKPEVLDALKALADTGHVEFLAAPHDHSLASVFSLQEFKEQVLAHHARIQALTGRAPTAFRNTALIYSDQLAREVEQLGYQVMLAGGGARLLGKRSPDRVYRPADCASLKLLVNNYTLSEDMSRRFTCSDSPESPPTSTGFAHWLNQANPARNGLINLSLDLTPFSRQAPDAQGLFLFLDKLPETVLLHKGGAFLTPTQAAAKRVSTPLSSAEFIAGENPEQDLSPWTGNEMQKDALNALYMLETRIKGSHNPALLRTWRRLQDSDHVLFMSTRREAAPTPLQPSNPYGSPYDAYINFMNIVTDLSERIPG
jgi:alpha-amylase